MTIIMTALIIQTLATMKKINHDYGIDKTEIVNPKPFEHNNDFIRNGNGGHKRSESN